jgi:hypothetical protein
MDRSNVILAVLKLVDLVFVANRPDDQQCRFRTIGTAYPRTWNTAHPMMVLWISPGQIKDSRVK